VVSLGARDLEGIWEDIRQVGRALDLSDRAEELVLGLQRRLEELRSLPRPHLKPRVLCIEWLDPLYLAGHWVPELVTAAGGADVGGKAGSHSVQRRWDEMAALKPDCLVVMLCGFGIDRARAELERLEDPAALALMQMVPTWILDGNAYTSRPGPRVVDGAARIRSALLGEPLPGIERWEAAGVC
jgi:iron complex transport system substrate-binding protein